MQPGFRVVESGTGSGILSTSFIRSIAPDGHLFTFEYHEDRAKAARETFEMNGIGEFVTVTCRDVCEGGFCMEDGSVDAGLWLIFLLIFSVFGFACALEGVEECV